jgi:hypothetical protein
VDEWHLYIETANGSGSGDILFMNQPEMNAEGDLLTFTESYVADNGTNLTQSVSINIRNIAYYRLVHLQGE